MKNIMMYALLGSLAFSLVACGSKPTPAPQRPVLEDVSMKVETLRDPVPENAPVTWNQPAPTVRQKPVTKYQYYHDCHYMGGELGCH